MSLGIYFCWVLSSEVYLLHHIPPPGIRFVWIRLFHTLTWVHQKCRECRTGPQQSRYPINFPTSCNLSFVLYFSSVFGYLQLVWRDISSGTIPYRECISCSWAGYSGWRAFFRLRYSYLPPLQQALLPSSKEVVWDSLSWELLFHVKADY